MHIISLSFDDGLERSNQKIAEIYERYGLSACFNVIALGHTADFVPPDSYHHGFPKGDFALWNELQGRGHEIMPHGLRHQNLAELPLEAAQQAITSCLDVFT
ncbi:MAG: polysaccharide deacetylase family protein, partial [Anaerolineales bacterium]|nr:polysaccharide deacetylase family protein [Anaerolineales bacterium]